MNNSQMPGTGNIAETITCVDCGGPCFLISYPDPELGFQPGDVAAYRCRDCMDRWDIVVEAEDLESSRHHESQ